MSGSNPLAVALGQVGQSNPLQFASGYADLATKAQALKTSQFDLQQKQQGLAYDAMRRLAMTNPDPSMADVQEALGGATRMGGLSDPIISNITSAVARGGKLSDIVRSYATGGMSPENQVLMGIGQPFSQDTGAGTVYGMRGGPLSAQPGAVTPSGFIQRTLTPAEASEPFTIQTPQGTFVTNRGNMVGGGAATGAPTGAAPAGGGAGVGGSALLPPGASYADAAARIDQIGQRESRNQNIPTAIKKPDGTPASTASGPYQFLDSTWQQAAREYGIPNPTARAMDTDPAIQREVAIRFLQTHGEAPWATSAPGGGGTTVAAAPGGGQGGPFIGATSAQPVVGGGAGAPSGAGPGANVRPAGGVQGYDAYGRPLGAGGGGGGGGGAPQIPGVTYTPGGGYVIRPTSPYEQPQLEQSSKDYVDGMVTYRSLGQRIFPLQNAISIIQSNPGLVTGPSAENWYQWVQGIAAATGIDVGDVHNANAYQMLAKQLANNLLQSGADPTDMARLMREASQPNTTQGKQAIVTLAAEQIGLQRLKSAQYLEFRSRHPNDANSNAQFYNQETADWSAQQDPVAYGADQIPQAEISKYYNSLNKEGRARFEASLAAAKRLFGIKLPIGGQNGG